MSYLLDSQNAELQKYVIPLTGTPYVQFEAPATIGQLTIGSTQQYTLPSSKAPGSNYILIDDTGSGAVTWEPIGASIGTYSFMDLTGSATSYDLAASDIVVKVTSATYDTITLPSAAGLGGKFYYVIRNSTNDALALYAQAGETVGASASQSFIEIHTIIKVISDDVDRWYVI